MYNLCYSTCCRAAIDRVLRRFVSHTLVPYKITGSVLKFKHFPGYPYFFPNLSPVCYFKGRARDITMHTWATETSIPPNRKIWWYSDQDHLSLSVSRILGSFLIIIVFLVLYYSVRIFLEVGKGVSQSVSHRQPTRLPDQCSPFRTIYESSTILLH